MNPMLLQKQLRENASDLQEYCKDLKSWGEDMKRKEEDEGDSKKPFKPSILPKTKKLRTGGQHKKVTFGDSPGKTSKHTPKLGITDYSAWAKFDADAECDKVDYDENDESDLTDDQDESKRDEAFVQKEKGNKFVKEKKWDEAISCYTKAIDCYAYDPIFYANRALCLLKTQSMVKAESDCTMSLKLDETYVKAYQRRAAAREALNKLEEAKYDLEKVLELEPKNEESRKSLENIKKKINKKSVVEPQRPISKFTASRSNKRTVSNIGDYSKVAQVQKVNATQPESHWPSGDDVILVKAIMKPPHLKSKAPLKRLNIAEIHEVPSAFAPVLDSDNTAVRNHVVEKKEGVPKIIPILKTDDLKIVEKKAPTEDHNSTQSKELNNDFNKKINENNEISLVAPKSSVQFYAIWRQLKSQEAKYDYLKLLEVERIPDVFKENLDSRMFSDILFVISEHFISNCDKIYPLLVNFTKVKRFSTFAMFMTSNDKNYLWKIIDFIKEHEGRTSDEIDDLIKLYEL